MCGGIGLHPSGLAGRAVGETFGRLDYPLE
jgi:hypothetical protein